MAPTNSADFPDKVFLAVNPHGVLIIDYQDKKILRKYPYSEVPTWGHSGSAFVLHVGTFAESTKLYFKTDFGKEINSLVEAYVQHLCDTEGALV